MPDWEDYGYHETPSERRDRLKAAEKGANTVWGGGRGCIAAIILTAITAAGIVVGAVKLSIASTGSAWLGLLSLAGVIVVVLVVAVTAT